MPPIRVALIGLSATATGTGWAATAHLPFLIKSPNFTITALCNSSIDAAKNAIEAYQLPSTTKAYGSPSDLAKDADIDLVIANTRVDKHAEVLLPSLKAGKDVFCEWPLDRNEVVAKEMLAAAKQGGGKAFVGLQGRQSRIIKTVKNLISSGKIGRVLSSSILGALTNGGAEEGTAVTYFTNRSVGGNQFTIGVGHCKFSSLLTYILLPTQYLSARLRSLRPGRLEVPQQYSRHPTARCQYHRPQDQHRGRD